MSASKAFKAALAATVFLSAPQVAAAAEDQDAKIADLQRQVDELKAIVKAMQAAQAAPQMAASAPAATSAPATTASSQTGTAAAQPVVLAAATPEAKPAPKKKAWHEKLMIRGYTQMRMNEIVGGPKNAPAGVSRLRSVQDSGISENGNFTLRRARLVVQGDISDRVSLYMQGDMAAAVSNQSANESRQHFFQMRDAYADVFLDKAKTLKVRLGQSKVPYGWENLQSSSNRVPLDRTDAINAPVPGERDLGVVLYYTPRRSRRSGTSLPRMARSCSAITAPSRLPPTTGRASTRLNATAG
ncbi:porin [Novosphingobium sp. THN1]|uniref:porin n=1 Tax=Novosphingobium sp. THN1 TaxID=1016987 RepID=UPI0026A35CBE